MSFHVQKQGSRPGSIFSVQDSANSQGIGLSQNSVRRLSFSEADRVAPAASIPLRHVASLANTLSEIARKEDGVAPMSDVGPGTGSASKPPLHPSLPASGRLVGPAMYSSPLRKSSSSMPLSPAQSPSRGFAALSFGSPARGSSHGSPAHDSPKIKPEPSAFSPAKSPLSGNKRPREDEGDGYKSIPDSPLSESLPASAKSLFSAAASSASGIDTEDVEWLSAEAPSTPPKSRFFSSSSTDTSPEGTPVSSPAKAKMKEDEKSKGPQTPEVVRQFNKRIRTKEPDSPMLKQERQQKEEALSALDQMKDTKKQQELLSMMGAAVLQNISPASPSKPKFHEDVVAALPDSQWAGPLLQDISKRISPTKDLKPGTGIIETFWDFSHITNFDPKTGGFHFFEPGNPLGKAVNVVALNPQTRSFCGMIDVERALEIIHDSEDVEMDEGNDPFKFSSFFGNVTTKEALTAFLRKTMPIARYKNRSLRAVPGNPDFFVEALHQEGGLVGRSAYPVFAHAFINKDGKPLVINLRRQTAPDKFITETVKISQGELLHWAKTALLGFIKSEETNKYQPIRYVLEEEIVIDIAPQMTVKTAVPYGIFVRVSPNFFKDLKELPAIILQLKE